MLLQDYAVLNIDENNLPFSGISYFPTSTELFKDTDILYTEVMNDESYRPDKIAYRLWQSQNISWILDVLNDFENGIKEYKRGTSLKYVSVTRLKAIGII